VCPSGLAGHDRPARRPHHQHRQRRWCCHAAVLLGLCNQQEALIRFSEGLAFEVKDHGIAVFAMGPGTVRTAMSEYSLTSPEGRTWLPWFHDIFDEGRDLPPERPAGLLVALASGKADILSGHYIYPADDLDRLIEQAREIETRKLYSLQVERL
jgi:hypothetical protein